MKQYILDNLQNFTYMNDKGLTDFLISIVISLVLGMLIFLAYRITYTGVAYSKRFNVSLVMLSMITTMVMAVISNNIALSLGMVGALSIVRFRTAVKDSRDTTFIFWCIAVGICCGVAQFALAAVGSGIIFLFLIVMGQVRTDGKYLYIIRCGQKDEKEVESIMFLYFRNVQLRAKNMQGNEVEFIYELSERALKKAKRTHEEDVTERLFALETLSAANLVMQTDDMSR
ncbi:DUF4956 domain-containing protein [Anaerovorax odorimutans]|uniref:DUF4956 domain-containing protein n=1 Tax=Anaerovorax odorimutans TaxID=109327 RepID=A0ABT1RPZ2_9FIRM|nr:DUF4956 domain-containing protein [Anaerovorax odorimutans]MCQ4637262.1 DUF4956 domain-containing protein [Anaerovorax odorimutans]